MLCEGMLNRRLQMILIATGLTLLHGTHMRCRTDLARFAHDAHFRSRFNQSLLMQQKGKIGEISWRRGPRPHQLSDLIHPTHHPLIKHVVVTHGVIDSLGSLDQTGQDLIEIVDWKCVINAQVGNGSLGAKAVTVPQFHVGIPFSAKEHYLPLPAAGHEDQDSVGLLEACQVKEIAVLAKGILRIAAASHFPGTGDNRDGVFIHHAHQVFSATGKFGFGDLHGVLPVMLASCNACASVTMLMAANRMYSTMSSN